MFFFPESYPEYPILTYLFGGSKVKNCFVLCVFVRKILQEDRNLYSEDRNIYEVDRSLYEEDCNLYKVDYSLYEVDRNLCEVDILFYNQLQPFFS